MMIKPVSRFRGETTVPGDKSISHRYGILGAMARGTTRISGFSTSQDCQSTLNCVEALGARIHQDGNEVHISSQGWQALRPPRKGLDAGNSGTTIRLLSAVLSALPGRTVIGGDESLNQRPMKRIVVPLTQMGAKIEARDDTFPPLEIEGARLQPIRYQLPVASAQVKSCVLLAGLTASGETVVVETTPSRDHTERALPVFGAPVRKNGTDLSVSGPADLRAASVQVPGDLSSAIYFVVAALLVPGSQIRISGVGVNPSRTGLLDLLEKSGAEIKRERLFETSGEPVCDLVIHHSEKFLDQFPGVISGEVIPNLIDEIPVLAVLGTALKQGLIVRDAAELRKKESDRIHSIVWNLREVGVKVEEHPDGFHILPGEALRGGRIKTFSDHRIAMSFAIAGLISCEGIEIDEPGCADISFPGFFTRLKELSDYVG